MGGWVGGWDLDEDVCLALEICMDLCQKIVLLGGAWEPDDVCMEKWRESSQEVGTNPRYALFFKS